MILGWSLVASGMAPNQNSVAGSIPAQSTTNAPSQAASDT